MTAAIRSADVKRFGITLTTTTTAAVAAACRLSHGSPLPSHRAPSFLSPLEDFVFRWVDSIDR
jgi:hypothetical protein